MLNVIIILATALIGIAGGFGLFWLSLKLEYWKIRRQIRARQQQVAAGEAPAWLMAANKR